VFLVQVLRAAVVFFY